MSDSFEGLLLFLWVCAVGWYAPNCSLWMSLSSAVRNLLLAFTGGVLSSLLFAASLLLSSGERFAVLVTHGCWKSFLRSIQSFFRSLEQHVYGMAINRRLKLIVCLGLLPSDNRKATRQGNQLTNFLMSYNYGSVLSIIRSLAYWTEMRVIANVSFRSEITQRDDSACTYDRARSYLLLSHWIRLWTGIQAGMEMFLNFTNLF